MPSQPPSAVHRFVNARKARLRSLLLQERKDMPFNRFRNALAAGGALLLAACTTIAPPTYPSDHPANAGGTAAPIESPSSSTLDSYRAAAASSQPGQSQPQPAADDHAGHKQNGTGQEQQKQETVHEHH